MSAFRIKPEQNGSIIVTPVYRRKSKSQSEDTLIPSCENETLHISKVKRSLKNAQSLVRLYAKDKSLVTILKEKRRLEKS